jgi:hypothetical protein
MAPGLEPAEAHLEPAQVRSSPDVTVSCTVSGLLDAAACVYSAPATAAHAGKA